MEPLISHLNGLFIWIVRSTVQASVLACLILAVQTVARRKLPSRWLYALWFLLIVRMAMPWAPESSFSVFNFVPVSSANTMIGVMDASDHTFMNPAVDWPPEPAVSVSVEREPASPVDTLPPPARRPSLPFLPTTWLAGLLAFMAYVFAENLLFWLKLRRDWGVADPRLLGLLADCTHEIGLRVPVGLVPTDQVESPAVFGFLRPRLLLPRRVLETLTQDELRFVFLHELAHLKRHDIVANWVLTLLQGLHWFNPIIWYAFHRMRADRELACDALTLSYTRPGEAQAYGRTIVSLVEQLYKVRRVPGLAGILEDKSQLKRRITMITLFTKHSYRWSILALVLVSLLAAVALTNAKADTPAGAPQDAGAGNANLAAKPITMKFNKTPLGDVLKTLAKHAEGTEIIVHVDEDIPVTIPQKEYGTAREALEAVADAVGLTVLEEPGRWRIVKVDSQGRIVDKIDYSFGNDPDVIGTWESVDFVDEPNQFKPGGKQRPGDLYLRELVILPEGETTGPWTWTKGLIFHPGDTTAGRYILKELDGETYMFFEWKSGDYTIRHMKPSYYVLKKTAAQGARPVATSSTPGERQTGAQPVPAPAQPTVSSKELNAKIDQLDIDAATLDDVIRTLGEPIEYVWGDQKFTKDNLPSMYCVVYPHRFYVVMNGGKIEELRHHEPGYVFRGKLQVGSSLDDVLSVIGQPKETVEGKPNEWQDGVLYKDIDGRKGFCYYQRTDQKVRFFFADYKVSALYVTRSDYGPGGGQGGSFKTVRPIAEVNEFDDVRWKDMSQLDLSTKSNLPSTLTFNQKTVWPDRAKMPAGVNPDELLLHAMNPGLGVRDLHRQGITGKGVNVAIIDQPLYQDHPEFAGKILAYHDVGCESESSMHGPAVASLLVGENCGAAPGARVYYVAAPSWTRDAAYQAKALDWIIDKNESLPESEKIRVVSISAAPSGAGSPFDKNNAMWDEACARAEAAGILVLDCTSHHGFIGPCWLDAADPENVGKCTPGFPKSGPGFRPGTLLVPTCPRTTAEEYDKGDCTYQYCGNGGLSWAIPYAAGVLALGWELRPELQSDQMCDLLFESAYKRPDGAQIIDPTAFIQLVKEAKPLP